ncbi:hypothetical protein GEV33_004525 [Tenebrio molitor]|uniref:Reverse transcriptase domain-containing protein n=1 Tax=Tenebrio molitor TaxID=7067 RepID=A0A8J6HN19_TENMO|nr:hypothetical protein GEV33_004525 [Tenebrio molitor]
MNLMRRGDPLVGVDHHHPSLEVGVTIGDVFKRFPIGRSSSFNFRKCNFVALYDALNVLNEVFRCHVPLRGRCSGSYPVWFNKNLITLLKKKNRAWRRYKTTGSVYDFETFKSLRRCFKADVAAVYREYVRRVNNDIKTDPKKFWSFLNSKDNSSSIPASMVYKNATIADPQIIVDSFADHFSKSFTRDAASTLPSASLPYDNLTLTRVLDDDVLKAVFEYVLYNSSLHYVSHKLSPNQHGFTKCRSTETNLVSISQYLSDALDNHSQVDVVYTDVSKAFDRIDHGLLLIKLDDRFMYVGVNGYASKSFKQESGVPQGSVLGPLFFNIFINDLVDDLDVPHLLFTDDMKIYLTIDSIDDALRLQGCIEEISKRCKLNNLVLNHLKCSIVSFTRKTKPLLFDYKINGSILTRRESIRDLGVIFDSKLSFGEHIRTIAGTAFSALGFVLRAGREFSDVATLKLLYITYVRSRFEYASLVWSPIYDVHSSLLERVQRRFLKNVVFMLNGAYPPRGCPQGLLLGEVGLQSLLDRRMEHSVIFLFKLFRGLQECPYVLERISLRVSRSGSRVRSVFYIGQRHTDIGLKSPVTRMLRNYQSVEAHIDIFCCSISQIKKFFSISSDARVAGSITTQGAKKGYILSRDSEVTLSHWSRSIELVIMLLIDFPRKPKHFLRQLFAESARAFEKENFLRELTSSHSQVGTTPLVTDRFKRPRRQEVPLWDESLAADKNHSPLSAWKEIWLNILSAFGCKRSPEVSRLTNYVVLWPFQALHHRLSGTRTREISQSDGRTLEQPRPVVLAASRGTAYANREPTIFFHGLISARSRPAIRPINEDHKDLLVELQQKKKLNDHQKIKLKDSYSIDKDKGKEVGGKVGRLQEPCEFPESANILSSTSVYINEEFSKPTISICNQEDKENAGAKESRLQELYEFPESAPTSCLQLLST